ncbi:isoprenylcysteine carboxylmethyltransferase family protein [Pseudanabaena biceps]|nr:isoprenylcysteine carboxylmethyltransferase family protein [Pseudanabaena biceps]
MTINQLAEQAVPLSVILFFLIAFVLPLVRLWLRTGTFAMAFSRNRDPIQKIVGAAIAVYMTSLCIWAVCYALLGKEALSIWQVPAPIQSIGWVLLVLGLATTVTAQAQMGISWRMGVDPEPTSLVTSGLFQVSRNPIYTGMLLTLFSYLFTSPCPWLIMGCLQFALLISLQTRYEEQALIKTHGNSYLEYAATVGRFFPKFGNLAAPSTTAIDNS